MATTTSLSPAPPACDDPASPLLEPSSARRSGGRGNPLILAGAARFLRRASSRRMMREQSVAVREAAAEHLEERQSDWAYSRPVVVLDILWNIAFIGTAASVLVISREERPGMPLRLWIAGYILQCLLHMVCVSMEFRRRRAGGSGRGEERSRYGLGSPRVSSHGSSYGDQDENPPSTVKHLESANTMFSFLWWVIGFYWVSSGGQDLTHEAPRLYWLCIAFLAFDVVFVVFCVAVACIIGLAVCCCLPCIIAILYAVTEQEGASEEDIRQFPKYKFRKNDYSEKPSGEITGSCGGIITECGSDPPIEHILSLEDAECCICLSAYEEGSELRELPCSHHFHCDCIDKWLHINATCPLCKFNVLKGSNTEREEV